jgi:hypothetical protein
MIFRIVSFVSVTTVLVAGLVLAPRFDYKVQFDSASGSYSVKPADLSLVCPGPLFRSGGDSGTNLNVIEGSGTADLYYTAKGSGELSQQSVSGSANSSIELGSSRVFGSSAISDATALTNLGANQDSEQGSNVLTGSSTQLSAIGSMRGLAAASCQQPSNDFVIVGGSTLAGREALLVLTNPSPIDATADIRIFTDLGEVTVSGLSGISIPAQSTTAVSLASFAPTVPSLAVQVQSQGAKLAGWIQARAVRGTAATGVDWVSPNPQASENSVLPGFVIRGTRVINQTISSEENSDAGHALRIFAPEGANVTVQIVSSEADVFGAVFTGIIEPGTVSDFPIAELKDGNYSVFVSSDKPVYSGLRSARGNPGASPRLDFAWLAPAEELVSDRAVSIPSEGDSILVLANTGSSASTVLVQNLRSGASVRVSVPTLGSATVDLSGPVSISQATGVYATVAVLIEGQISDLDVRDPRNLGSEVRVVFR